VRGDQLSRQWQVIQRLARSRVGVGASELAEELECHRRTIYRDLDALMYAGFPVVSEKRDGHVYYRFLDNFQIGEVPFTADETLALAFGADLLRGLEGTLFHDSIRSALAKIRATLGPELTAYLERVGETFKVLPGPHKRYVEARETIQTLGDAVLARRTLRMRYHTGRTATESERDLDPYRVWYRDGGLYVIGHDHQSGEIRTFAVDRIRSIERTERGFEPDPDFDFESYVSASFGVIAEPATAVRIRFAKGWAAYVEEHSWHPSQKLETLPDGGVELTMEVGGTSELRSWVMSFGAGARVLEPEALRDGQARARRGGEPVRLGRHA
jgi:predicted DNA-binding transcriptional regulator YafY